MSDLTLFGIDPNVEVSEGGKSAIPPGMYKAVIVGDALRDNKAGSGKVLALSLQITEGAQSGKTVDDNLNLTNASAVAAQIGQGVLKKICQLTNVQFPPQNTAAMYGKPLVITVIADPYTKKDGTQATWHKISRYDAVGTTAPVQPPAAGGNAW